MTNTHRWLTVALVLTLGTWASQAMADKPAPGTQPPKPRTTHRLPPAPKGTTLSPAALQRLLRCALINRFDTYQSTQKTIPIGKRRIGMFTSGWDTLLFVFKVPRCIASLTTKRGNSRIGAVAALAGLPLYGPKQKSQSSSQWLNHYNPALVKWIAQHIPKPSQKIVGVSFQKIYDYSVKRIVRINAYTYLYLQEGKGKKLYEAYVKLHAKPAGAKGRASFEQRLRQKALRNKIEKSLKYLVRDSMIVGKYIEYHPGEAALFLMRRMMGGSAPAIWALLKQVLDQYDPKFLPRVTKKRPLGVIKLWLPKKTQYKTSVWDASQVKQVGLFLAKVPPNTRVQLKPGVYRIDASWSIKGAKNVVLEGIGKGKVEIVSTALTETVLSITKSENVKVHNLHMRHTKPSPDNICSGQVIYINDSRKIWIDKNELNGSGTVGVIALTSQKVVITRNYIHSNTQAGVDLFMVKSASVMYNKIINNAAGLVAHQSTFTMGQNQISNNKVGYLQRRSFAWKIIQRIKASKKQKP